MAKPSAIEAFEANLADADMLVGLSRALENRRVYRMREELRERVGAALSVAKKHRAGLDCVESEDLFVVLKPTGSLSRGDLTEESLRPLLRQAVVALCAAVETYVADRVMELFGPVIKQDDLPSRLAALAMTVGDWHAIERDYTRRGWGLREVVRRQIESQASASPSQLGKLFSAVGVSKLLERVDKNRGVGKGRSAEQLDEIVERRNRIAHAGDRKGRGRATISVEEVDGYTRQSTRSPSYLARCDVVPPGGLRSPITDDGPSHPEVMLRIRFPLTSVEFIVGSVEKENRTCITRYPQHPI
jgi:hypothetical protein